MYSYIIGTIKEVYPSFIVIDNNNIGYKVNVSNPYYYEIDKDYKIYLYNHVREDEYSLYGFKDIDERELFLKLIDVKGLGPKMALPMFATGSTSGIIDAINRENILYLKKFPKIGDKVAKQMILDLKGKVGNTTVLASEIEEDVTLALVALGYKNSDIVKILPKINKDFSIEDKIKEALKLLLK